MENVTIPDAPWCWYIYLHDWVIIRANVGKYTSNKEHMEMKSITDLLVGG